MITVCIELVFPFGNNIAKVELKTSVAAGNVMLDDDPNEMMEMYCIECNE